jgi:hypothetical protein
VCGRGDVVIKASACGSQRLTGSCMCVVVGAAPHPPMLLCVIVLLFDKMLPLWSSEVCGCLLCVRLCSVVPTFVYCAPQVRAYHLTRLVPALPCLILSHAAAWQHTCTTLVGAIAVSLVLLVILHVTCIFCGLEGPAVVAC